MPRLIKKYFKAKEFRKRGYSLKEISTRLGVSKSTVSTWMRDIEISEQGMKRIDRRKQIGRIKSSRTKRIKREKKVAQLRKEARAFLRDIPMGKKYLRLLCALLFCCEGTKDTRGGIAFINSDPYLVKTFVALLRKCFDIDEKRFRVTLHLHEYHSVKKQILFWSEFTEIPPSQFIKPYQKPHTGKRLRENYPGCASIRYYDSKLAQKLLILAQEFLQKYNKGV